MCMHLYDLHMYHLYKNQVVKTNNADYFTLGRSTPLWWNPSRIIHLESISKSISIFSNKKKIDLDSMETEAITEWFCKIALLPLASETLKISAKKFIFWQSSNQKFTTLLKMNSFADILQIISRLEQQEHLMCTAPLSGGF